MGISLRSIRPPLYIDRPFVRPPISCSSPPEQGFEDSPQSDFFETQSPIFSQPLFRFSQHFTVGPGFNSTLPEPPVCFPLRDGFRSGCPKLPPHFFTRRLSQFSPPPPTDEGSPTPPHANRSPQPFYIFPPRLKLSLFYCKKFFFFFFPPSHDCAAHPDVGFWCRGMHITIYSQCDCHLSGIHVACATLNLLLGRHFYIRALVRSKTHLSFSRPPFLL